MSWVPEFEIDLWNAWLLILYYPLHPLIFIVIDKLVGTSDIMKKMGDVPLEQGEKIAAVFSLVVTLLLIVYSIFLPLKLGTVWFYAGIAIYLIGLLMFLIAIANIATTPLGHPFSIGMYRYSRHPMVIGSSITFIGVSIASASWLFLLLSVILTALNTYLAVAEERSCLEIYGDEYQAYLDKTARWIGIPKSESQRS